MTEPVPADFTVPRDLLAPEFRLEPLGERHNASDRAHLDAPLYRAVSDWLTGRWPPREFRYAPR
ncbi:hypothetical protein [Kitasatospora sp. NPDC001132]